MQVIIYFSLIIAFVSSLCGDKICTIEENCVSCPGDCGFFSGCLVDRLECPDSADYQQSNHGYLVEMGPRRLALLRQLGYRSSERAEVWAALSEERPTISGLIPYAKSKPLSVRHAFGQQGALFTTFAESGGPVWLGVREPFCSLSLKMTNEVDLDEFGVSYFVAQAVDDILDIGMVPPTTLVRRRIDVKSPHSKIVQAFLSTGPANVIADAISQNPGESEIELNFIAQATLNQDTKTHEEKGVKLLRPDGDFVNPLELVVECGKFQNSTACSMLKSRCRSKTQSCFHALYFAALCFVVGMPIMTGPTSVFWLPGTGDPLLVGDTDRSLHCPRLRKQILLDTPGLTSRNLDPVEDIRWVGKHFFPAIGFFPDQLWRRLNGQFPGGQYSTKFGDNVLTYLVGMPGLSGCAMRFCSDSGRAQFSAIVSPCLSNNLFHLRSTAVKLNLTKI